MTILRHTLRGSTALALILSAAACGGNDASTPIDAPPPPPPIDAPPVVAPPAYHQVEQLARPAINEALLITSAYNDGYNATAPTFTGVPTDTLNLVVGEAKTVLKALYLGTCLLDGALGATAETGLHPAGITCHAVGPALWTENTLAGVTLTDASVTAAQAYADKVFAQFIPDVLRVDTSVTSNYLTLCGDANSKPLLCGGRFLSDDVVDITYDYLLAGAAINKAADPQLRALVSDGVTFSPDDAKNSGNVSIPDPANAQQGHPDVSNTFPYSAAPF
jgi:Domain of unknown function (DUF4331)